MKDDEIRMRCIECATNLNKIIAHSNHSLESLVKCTIHAAEDLEHYAKTGKNRLDEVKK